MPESNWGLMDPTAKLIPDILEPAGYTTAVVGKRHLGLEAPTLRPLASSITFTASSPT